MNFVQSVERLIEAQTPTIGTSEGVKVGDRIEFWHNPYQHSAYVIVTKINRKSIVAYEREGSYRAGCRWVLHKEWDGWTYVRRSMTTDTRPIPEGVKIF